MGRGGGGEEEERRAKTETFLAHEPSQNTIGGPGPRSPASAASVTRVGVRAGARLPVGDAPPPPGVQGVRARRCRRHRRRRVHQDNAVGRCQAPFRVMAKALGAVGGDPPSRPPRGGEAARVPHGPGRGQRRGALPQEPQPGAGVALAMLVDGADAAVAVTRVCDAEDFDVSTQRGTLTSRFANRTT